MKSNLAIALSAGLWGNIDPIPMLSTRRYLADRGRRSGVAKAKRSAKKRRNIRARSKK